MLEKKTIIDQIEILRSGHIQIRSGKLVVEDDKIISSQWHRTALDPGTDIDLVLNAVNVHLEQMREARCGEEKTPFSELTPQFLREKVLMIHTPELVQKYRDLRAIADAAMKPPPTLMQKIINALTP
jgi:hypothetical protein